MKRLIREQETKGVMIAARVAPAERVAIEDLARRCDRTPSREVRRAIRFYLAHWEAADAFLRDQSEQQARV
jgi:hypothetical protein